MSPTNTQSPDSNEPDTNPAGQGLQPGPAPAPIAPEELHRSAVTGLPSTLSELPAPDQPPAPAGRPIASPEPVRSEQSAAPAADSLQPPVGEPVSLEALDQTTPEYIVVPPAAVEPEPPLAKKKGRKKRILIIVAAVVVLLFGTGSAVFALWYNNPEKAVVDAAMKAATAETVVSSGVVDMSVDGADETVKAKVTFTSKVHSTEAHAQLAAKLSLTVGANTSEFDGEGMMSSAGNVFFKFNNLSSMYGSYIKESEYAALLKNNPELEKSVTDFIKKIDGTWIKISQDDIKTVQPSYDYAKLKSCAQDAQKNLMNSSDQQKQLRDIYSQNQFLQISSKGQQTIDGAMTNKYSLGLDISRAYDAAIAYEKTDYAKANSACLKYVLGEDAKSEAIDKPDDDTIRNQQQQIDKVKTDIYVTTFGHELKRVTVAYADNESKTSVQSVFNFSYDQPVTTGDPSKSIPLSELQEDLENIQEQLLDSFLAPESDTVITT